MDYKKIIKSRNMRLKILDFFNFIPDELMIRAQYRIKVHRHLNLRNPKRYTEKLQWYKLYYRDPLMEECADKFKVRNYVKSKQLGYTLNEIYGEYDDISEINFRNLPNQFVIKTTNGGGGNNVFLCNDKRDFNEADCKKLLKQWLRPIKKNSGREWVYTVDKPRIIIEKMLKRDINNDIPDYKFFCFNGKVYYLYTMIDYIDNHNNGKLGFYDSNFNPMPYYRKDFEPINKTLKKPKNFEKMLEVAQKLSEGFPHVRVDLYNIDGDIIFGELTFFNASGYTIFVPDEFDFILGDKFILPDKNFKGGFSI